MKQTSWIESKTTEAQMSDLEEVVRKCRDELAAYVSSARVVRVKDLVKILDDIIAALERFTAAVERLYPSLKFNLEIRDSKLIVNVR
jgi:hypothetical protein